MADARTAIMITLDPAHEGGFQDNPQDRANWTGGKIGVGQLVGTNGGITTLDMPGVDIKNLTVDQKVNYYLEHYWKPFYSQISNQLVANKLFDMGVLFGVGTAVGLMQRSVDVPVDDSFGPMTLQALNSANAALLLATFKEELHTHAVNVAAANPAEAFALPGWHHRIDS